MLHVAVEHADHGAGHEGAENGLQAGLLGDDDQGDEEQHGAPDPDLCSGVLQANKDLGDLHAPAQASYRCGDDNEEKDEDAEKDELRASSGGVTGEQQG